MISHNLTDIGLFSLASVLVYLSLSQFILHLQTLSLPAHQTELVGDEYKTTRRKTLAGLKPKQIQLTNSTSKSVTFQMPEALKAESSVDGKQKLVVNNIYQTIYKGLKMCMW